MKNIIRRYLAMGLGLALMFANAGCAEEDGFGSKAALEKEEFTIEEMLEYAIEDEYAARAEYEKIMDEYGVQRPFSNIIRSEETHIELLEPLFETYGVEIPNDTSEEHVVVPESIQEAFEIGVQAEIDNIEMYEKFLAQDLPEDVEDVFTKLKNASENHLNAFERGVQRDGQAAGNRRGNGNGGRWN